MIPPVFLPIFGPRVHPHAVFEVIAYTGGFQFYRVLRRHWTGPKPAAEQTLWILVGAIGGALVGSRVLALLESWPDYVAMFHESHNPLVLLAGKTIVGGILGGWAGVEAAKKIVGVDFSTGDLFVLPMAFGMAVGRVGCFCTGLSDHTCGSPTNVPWAVDFGDGIPRHPAQLYDIAFLGLIGAVLAVRLRRPHRSGAIFLGFMLGYCIYRGCVEFIKPTGPHHAGLSAIQWACAGGAMVAGMMLLRREPPPSVGLMDGGFVP